MMCQAVGDRFAVFASKGGAPTNPDWYHNLLANERASVEIGTEAFDVIATEAEGEERERIWEIQKQRYPGFATYEEKADRRIPVMLLERVADPAERLRGRRRELSARFDPVRGATTMTPWRGPTGWFFGSRDATSASATPIASCSPSAARRSST